MDIELKATANGKVYSVCQYLPHQIPWFRVQIPSRQKHHKDTRNKGTGNCMQTLHIPIASWGYPADPLGVDSAECSPLPFVIKFHTRWGGVHNLRVLFWKPRSPQIKQHPIYANYKYGVKAAQRAQLGLLFRNLR